MALTATDWTVDRQTGDIRYIGDDHNEAAPSYATVIEFHRWLQGLADDASSTGNDDELDITDNTPSDRSTDNIITLLPPYNIDDAASEHLYDGSIIQNGGDDVYDGIVNFGNASVQIQIIQDGAVLADDWWNKSTPTATPTHDGSNGASVLSDSGEAFTVDEYIGYTVYNTTDGSQALITDNDGTTITGSLYGGTDNDWDTGDAYVLGVPLNGDAAAGISHRFMIKTRSAGVDIDGRRLIGIARRFGNTYSEFKINGTSNGNNVLALSDATDLNNSTDPQTVSTWDQFANDNQGYFSQDVNNDSTTENYYSNWDIGGGTTPASPTINDLYEWAKWITTQGTASTMYGISGELFRGITLEIPVDTAVTTIDFSAFESVDWTGGTGQLLAIDDVNAPTKMWIQLLTGVAPTDGQTIQSTTNTTNTTADVNGTVTDREPLLKFPFIGNSTGSAIIGAYGINVDSGDLTASDTLFDLDNATVTPPNNVTFEVGGLESGEDYVTVTPRGLRFAYDTEASGPFQVGETLTFSGAATATAVLAELIDQGTEGYMIVSEAVTGSLPTGTSADNAVITGGTSSATAAINGAVSSDTNSRQYTLNTTLAADGITSVVVNETIDSDMPSSGVVRVQDDNGYFRKLLYTSITAPSTFVVSNPGDTEDNFLSVNATGGTTATGNNVYVSFIDKAAAAATESVTVVYDADRNVFVRVRDGDAASPIKTFETTGTISSSGGSATAIRTSDE